jgi:hypothetical protein
MDEMGKILAGWLSAAIIVNLSFMTAILYTYIKKVSHLRQKKFFLLMDSLLLTISVLNILIPLLLLRSNHHHKNEDLKGFQVNLLAGLTILGLMFGLIYLCFTIYIIKFWVIAVKVDYFKKDKDPMKLECMIKTVFYSLVVWSFAGGVIYIELMRNSGRKYYLSEVDGMS